jgi:outer membrane protein OmpA-like peptidoglycan-associated protein
MNSARAIDRMNFIQAQERTIMIKLSQTARFTTLAGFCASALIGCASAPPPKELVDARAAYTRSESGPARQYDPAGLHEAKVALDKAENAYSDAPGAESTQDLAYLALRRTERADAEASLLAAQQRRDKAISAASAAQAKAIESAQSELTKTKQQLETEHAAREAAEARAKDTLTKLAAASAASVKEEPRGTVITLAGGVLFPSGKADLLPGAQTSLTQIAEVIRDQPNKKVLVEGHTDARGTEASNLTLSKARADSVGAFLGSRGVPSDHITTSGLGSSRPIADNNSPEGRANNRRVELVIQTIEAR